MAEMKQFKLQGVNALNEKVQYAKDVSHFVNENLYFRVEKSSPGTLKLVTPKGSYYLRRNTQQNIFQGTFGGHKVQIHLKKVSGWIGYY